MSQKRTTRIQIKSLPETLTDLASPDAKTRREAVRTLAFCHKAQATEHLLELLTDTSSSVRSQAAHELRQFPNSRVIESLFERFSDTHINVRVEVIASLGHLRRESQTYQQQQIAELLIACLRDQRERLRLAALDAVGWWYDARLCEALITLLHERNRSLPFDKVAQALEHQSYDRPFQEYRAILHDPTWDVASRVSAVHGIARQCRSWKHQSEAFATLTETLKDSEPQIRLAAVKEMHGYWEVDQRTLITEALLTMLSDPFP